MQLPAALWCRPSAGRIRGSVTTAVILVGLMVPDLRPGQHLFTEQIDKVCAIFGAMLIANVMFLALGLFAAKLFARVTLAPRGILWPILFPFIVLGAYSLAQSMLDVYITLTFCVVGYLSRRFGFAVAPAVIGLILGEMVETKL